MSVSRIAIRYSKPLLELAEENKILEEVHEDMKSFDSVCRQNKDFVLMLKSPIIPHLKKLEILKKIFSGKVSALTMTAMEIIVRKNREKYLPEITKEFLVLYNLKMGLQEVTITTTFPLDNQRREAFRDLVTQISGKKPLIKEKIDPELIGGYVLKMDDKQIDNSVRSKLAELKLKFEKGTL